MQTKPNKPDETSGNSVPATRSLSLSINQIRSEVANRSKVYPLTQIREAGLMLEIYSERNVKQIAKISRELTVSSAVNGGLQFSKIKAQIRSGEISERSVAEALGALLDLTLRQFNLPRIMDGDQIAFLCLDILDRYPLLKFEELVFIFREAITGKYNRGKDAFFGGISAFHVHGWINSYLEQDRAKIEEEAEREHLKRKQDERAKNTGSNLDFIRAEYERIKAEANGAPKTEEPEIRPEERKDYLQRLREKCAAPDIYSDERLRSWIPFYEREGLTAALEIVNKALEARAKNKL